MVEMEPAEVEPEAELRNEMDRHARKHCRSMEMPNCRQIDTKTKIELHEDTVDRHCRQIDTHTKKRPPSDVSRAASICLNRSSRMRYLPV